MDSGNTSGDGAHKKESRQLLSEQKDIVEASDYARKSVKEMVELEKKYDKMGLLKLIWDSKVPEKDKGLLQFFIRPFSLKCTDKEQVKEEIRKYITFYEAMLTAMEKLRGNKEKSSSEADDPSIIISDLNKLLNDLDKIAQSDISITESSTIFKLHKQFMVKHEQLENKVKRIECVVSRDRIKTLTTLLDSCQNTILVFQNGLQDFQRLKNGMEEQVRELVIENEKLRQQQQSLVAVNTKLREDQQKLITQSNDACSRMKNIEKLINKVVNERKN